MSQRQLNHLTNLGQLLADSTNIIVDDIFSLFLFIAVDWLTLIEKCCLRGDDTVLGWINVDNLELDWTEASSHDEGVSLLDWSVAVLKVWDQVGLCNVARDALDRVSKR